MIVTRFLLAFQMALLQPRSWLGVVVLVMPPPPEFLFT